MKEPHFTPHLPTQFNKLNKSIYNNYLLTAEVPLGYHRMNSFSKNERDTQSENLTNNVKYNFTFTIPNTEIKMNRELLQLSSLNNDLENWITCFRDTVKICNWTDTQAHNILRAIIHPNIFNLIKQLNTVDTILDTLLSIQYQPEDYYKYFEEAKRIKQNKFFRITEYKNEIERIFRILAVGRAQLFTL